MKKTRLFLLPIFLFFLFSCSSVEQAMQKELEKVYIGMPVDEFKQKIKKATVVYLDDEYACYKLNKRYARFGDPNRYSYASRFFYFKQGKLWKIDEGERATDYRIRIDK